MNLLEITKQLHELETAVIESNGELTPELEKAFAVSEMTKKDQIAAYAAILDRLDTLQNEYKSKIDSLQAVLNGFKRFENFLKGNLKEAMKLSNTDELAGQETRFKLTRTKPKLVIDCDASALPWEFTKTISEVIPDKDMIREFLESGKTLENCKLEESFALRKYMNRKELK